MPFSLTGQIRTAPGVESSTRFAASEATTAVPIDDGTSADRGVSDVSDPIIVTDPIVVLEPPVDILPPVFVPEVVREELRDGAGNLTGYRDTVSGPGFSSVTEFDAAMNLVSSEYSDSSGYRSSTARETLTDAAGEVTGYRETSVGHGPGYSYDSVTNYDTRFNLVDARYSDSNGYTSTTSRSELRDGAGALTGYRVESSGSGSGYSYSSTEVFDAAYSLLRSEYSDGNGYRSTYSVQTQRDESGAVIGYVTSYTWTDGTSVYSNTDRFDANWNYLGGDSSKPDVVVDDGPKMLPLVSEDAPGAAREALASAQTSGSDAVDGSAKRGAKLKASAGDDTFYVDDTRDHVGGSGKGDDTVMSDTVSLDLRRDAYKGIENASLMGRDDLDLRGDRGSNELSGNGGDNRIDGDKGSDTLFGGLGGDVFVIRGGQKGTPDTITDFNSGEDDVALIGRSFRGLFDADGHLRDGVLGDRLLFDATTGELSFDRDGESGRAGAKVIAVLIGVSSVSADDFVHS